MSGMPDAREFGDGDRVLWLSVGQVWTVRSRSSDFVVVELDAVPGSGYSVRFSDLDVAPDVVASDYYRRKP